MNNFTQLRKQIKQTQKRQVMNNLGKISMAHLIYLIPITLLSIISTFISVNSLTQQVYYFQQSSLSSYTLSSYSTLLTILQLVVSGPLTFGLMNFYIRLMREGNASPTLVIHPLTSLKMAWRGIRMELTLAVRAFIVSIGPIILISIILSAIMLELTPEYGQSYASPQSAAYPAMIFALVACVLFLLVLIFISVKIMMYQAGYLLLQDHDDLGAWKATQRSNNIFRGHFKDLLVFFFSFTPWGILLTVLSILAALPALLPLVSFITGYYSGYYTDPLSLIAGVVITILLEIILSLTLSSWLSAYMQTSFFSLFEHIAPAPVTPVQFQANQTPYQTNTSFTQSPIIPSQNSESSAQNPPSDTTTPAQHPQSDTVLSQDPVADETNEDSSTNT